MSSPLEQIKLEFPTNEHNEFVSAEALQAQKDAEEIKRIEDKTGAAASVIQKINGEFKIKYLGEFLTPDEYTKDTGGVFDGKEHLDPYRDYRQTG